MRWRAQPIPDPEYVALVRQGRDRLTRRRHLGWRLVSLGFGVLLLAGFVGGVWVARPLVRWLSSASGSWFRPSIRETALYGAMLGVLLAGGVASIARAVFPPRRPRAMDLMVKYHDLLVQNGVLVGG